MNNLSFCLWLDNGDMVVRTSSEEVVYSSPYPKRFRDLFFEFPFVGYVEDLDTGNRVALFVCGSFYQFDCTCVEHYIDEYYGDIRTFGFAYANVYNFKLEGIL